MHIYKLRKNFSINLQSHDHFIKGKLAFKTKDDLWCHTQFPAVTPISIHSTFHEGLNGEMKMNAFISTIKQNLRENLTILMTEKAHLNTLGLKFKDAADISKRDALLLIERFRPLFQGCKITHWEEYINKDPNYPLYAEKIMEMYASDITFQKLLVEDAQLSYSPQRQAEYPNKDLYVEKTIEDILEQCICLLVLINKGYRLYFYPGAQYAAVNYVNKEALISFIHVFVSIEKKVILRE